MLYSIDDLWQGHFHSETVMYTQKFILQNFRINFRMFLPMNFQVKHFQLLDIMIIESTWLRVKELDL